MCVIVCESVCVYMYTYMGELEGRKVRGKCNSIIISKRYKISLELKKVEKEQCTHAKKLIASDWHCKYECWFSGL